MKSFFGIKKHYTYDKVTSIAYKDDSYSMRDTLIYVDDRKVKVTEISNGGKQFISYVKKKYSALNNGQCIREISKTKRDIFYNGNITSPILHMSLQIFVCIFVFGFTVLVFFISPVQFTASDTIEQQVSFSSYRIWFNDLILHSTDGNTYMLHISSLPSNIEKIKELCNGTDILTVYSTKNTPKRGLVYDYWIRELSYDGDQLLTFEDDYRFNHRIWIYLVILAVISSLTVVTHFVGSIFVGRHPERYSKRIRRLFFKSWAWRKSNIIHKK